MPRTRRQVADPTLAVAYLRTSTDDQANGLDAQSDAAHAYARSKGLRVVSVHRDAGVSGGKPVAERVGFTAALAAMKEAGAGVLLVAKRDRLARDVVEAAMAARLVERIGARVMSADGVSHEDTPEARLLRTMIDAFAEFERALIRSRTKAALRARRDRGQRFARFPPYGWRYDATGKMIVVPVQQETLLRMRRLRSRGVAYRVIGERLMAEGRRPARAKAWSIPVVRSLILRK
jgi:site-specific DNA recombinase